MFCHWSSGGQQLSVLHGIFRKGTGPTQSCSGHYEEEEDDEDDDDKNKEDSDSQNSQDSEDNEDSGNSDQSGDNNNNSGNNETTTEIITETAMEIPVP